MKFLLLIISAFLLCLDTYTQSINPSENTTFCPNIVYSFVLSISNPNDYEIIINNSNLLQKEGSDIYGSSSISFKLKFANQWNQVPVITIRTKGANSQVIKSFPFYFIASLKDVAPFQNQSLTVPLCTNQDINLI